MTDGASLEAGDVVVDRDTEERDRLVVVGVHADYQASAWRIDSLEATVADLNPAYPDEDHVVTCAYREDVGDVVGTDADTADIQREATFGSLRTYSFPRSRVALPEVKQ